MNNYAITYNGSTYDRISKAKARNEFINGKTIILCASNQVPFTKWYPYVSISKPARGTIFLDEESLEETFNDYVASFEFYNCHNSETGTYASFYIAREE